MYLFTDGDAIPTSAFRAGVGFAVCNDLRATGIIAMRGAGARRTRWVFEIGDFCIRKADVLLFGKLHND
jgi:hypothetical protein